ncbi:hypothetical protein FA15DRAFT_679829 [Coprinopsis marcescibilis]|uniref:SH3 domain-containing protein n=1 Tax=Coprinopsis marcescibilis TaxID=230819 RepID=A0A5C3L0K9_COPMA|nr:hypothetical protein FA15DRAFT_679829 [Coprinopsis marcescibilis]
MNVPVSPTDTIASGFSCITPPQSARLQRTEAYPLPTPATSFCIALYPYSDSDPAILSFGKNEVLEVLSRHPSGWWDCLVGGSWNGYGLGGQVRRGWVPSNYVKNMEGRSEARAAMVRNGRSAVKP